MQIVTYEFYEELIIYFSQNIIFFVYLDDDLLFWVGTGLIIYYELHIFRWHI